MYKIWYVAEPENDIHYIIEQIKYDKNCSFPDLEHNWKATTQFRLKSIQTSTSTQDILNNWTNYKLPLGYRLVIFTLKIYYNLSLIKKKKKNVGIYKFSGECGKFMTDNTGYW